MNEIYKKKLIYQIFFTLKIFVIFFLLATVFKSYAIEKFGASILVIFIYLIPFLYLVIFNPKLLVKFWKIVAIFFCVSLSIITFMGILPSNKFFGLDNDSLGGEISIFLAREPFYWNEYNFSIWHYIQSVFRVIIFLLIGVSITHPKKLFSLIFKIKYLFRFIDIRNVKFQIDKVSSLLKIIGIIKSVIYKKRSSHKEITNIKKINEKTDLKNIKPEVSIWNNNPEIKAPKNDYSSAIKFKWQVPNTNVLELAPMQGVSSSEINETSNLIEKSLEQYGIDVSVDSEDVKSGPTVTMYGVKPGWKGDIKTGGQRVRVDTILNREKDLALALASPSLRFEAPVPGESVVGIEVPNKKPQKVTIRSITDTNEWNSFKKDSALPVPLGIGTDGNPVMCDLAKMPHTLIAGSTGSGKSVCMNAIITGLMLTLNPTQVRMIMLDPKRVELTPYDNIPHLYSPVVVETERAIIILKSLVNEMMERFKLLEEAGVKNITAYNIKTNQRMPYLVVLVDELADLMLTAAGEIERLLVRLAQLGRATGVHLVVATQRPSVDVVTGLIKANFPSRISFSVMSQIDSRTILDSPGAEKLLGKGDMLYLPVDRAKPLRIQGLFLTDKEISDIVSHWKNQSSPDLPELSVNPITDNSNFTLSDSAGDSLYEKAVLLTESQRTLSVSLLQRRLRIGYPRAARLMDELEEAGIVGPGDGGKPRQVL
ncbi:MAG: cell division protein FtsK [Chloroflexi bacterium]|nr:cell division protein FtsK [Chloroflexota bacterium]|tara:strand:+ start:1599 stop:3725 length:2127 start_codon:yes stop_codon:yes gene_type:complete